MTRGRRDSRGFSLIEVLISVVIMVVVVLGMATLFDRGAAISKTETGVTDAQQSVRYAAYQLTRELRMAGCGGIPANPDSLESLTSVRQASVSLYVGSTTYPPNVAKFRSNDVGNWGGSGTDISIGGTSHFVRRGTDFLHIRGVLTTALYDLNAGNWDPSTGQLIISNCTTYTDPLSPPKVAACGGYAANDMSYFQNLPTTWTSRLFVMKDAQGLVAIGLVASKPSPTTAGGLTTATITIDFTNPYAQSLNPGGAFPTSQLTDPVRGGFVDDRIYFVDEGPDASAVCGTSNASVTPGPCHPVLSYADWQAGDSSAAPFSTATVTPIADDIEDLQVAYGYDFYDVVKNVGTYSSPAPAESANALYPSDGSLSITNQATFNSITAGTLLHTDPSEDLSAADADEWIFNVAGEPAGGAVFNETTDLSRLRGLEIAILGKGSQPDPKYAGPGARSWPIMDSQAKTVSADNNLPYHRRLQTIRINLRNFQAQ